MWFVHVRETMCARSQLSTPSCFHVELATTSPRLGPPNSCTVACKTHLKGRSSSRCSLPDSSQTHPTSSLVNTVLVWIALWRSSIGQHLMAAAIQRSTMDECRSQIAWELLVLHMITRWMYRLMSLEGIWSMNSYVWRLGYNYHQQWIIKLWK